MGCTLHEHPPFTDDVPTISINLPHIVIAMCRGFPNHVWWHRRAGHAMSWQISHYEWCFWVGKPIQIGFGDAPSLELFCHNFDKLVGGLEHAWFYYPYAPCILHVWYICIYIYANIGGILMINGTIYTGWWFGTWILFFHILGMSLSQLTFDIFQRGRSTTNQNQQMCVDTVCGIPWVTFTSKIYPKCEHI